MEKGSQISAMVEPLHALVRRSITSKTYQFEDSTYCGVQRKPDEKCEVCWTEWLYEFFREGCRGEGTQGKNIKGGVKSKVRQQSRSAVPEAGE